MLAVRKLKAGLGSIFVAVLLLAGSPTSAGCMNDVCGVASDADGGTTIRVDVDFPPGHTDHEHTILITGVDANNYVLWWEEVSGPGNVFVAIVPKSVREKIAGVDAMIEGPTNEFESAGTKRKKGPLPVGVLKLPIKRSMFH